jgi:hypothetical protein
MCLRKLAADYTSSSQSSTFSPRHSFSSYSSSQEERPQVMDHDQSRPAQSTPPKRHPNPEDAWGYDAFDAAMNRTRMENEASACEIDRGLRAFAGRSHPNQLRDLLLYITRPQTKDKANDLEGLPPKNEFWPKPGEILFATWEKFSRRLLLLTARNRWPIFSLKDSRIYNQYQSISKHRSENTLQMDRVF